MTFFHNLNQPCLIIIIVRRTTGVEMKQMLTKFLNVFYNDLTSLKGAFNKSPTSLQQISNMTLTSDNFEIRKLLPHIIPLMQYSGGRVNVERVMWTTLLKAVISDSCHLMIQSSVTLQVTIAHVLLAGFATPAGWFCGTNGAGERGSHFWGDVESSYSCYIGPHPTFMKPRINLETSEVGRDRRNKPVNSCIG